MYCVTDPFNTRYRKSYSWNIFSQSLLHQLKTSFSFTGVKKKRVILLWGVSDHTDWYIYFEMW